MRFSDLDQSRWGEFRELIVDVPDNAALKTMGFIDNASLHLSISDDAIDNVAEVLESLFERNREYDWALETQNRKWFNAPLGLVIQFIIKHKMIMFTINHDMEIMTDRKVQQELPCSIRNALLRVCDGFEEITVEYTTRST